MNTATFQIFYNNKQNKRVSMKRKLPVWRNPTVQRNYVEMALLEKKIGVSRLLDFNLA